MRRFNIKVNGKSYDVEVEETGAVQSAPVVTQVSEPAPAPKAAAVATPAAAPAAPKAAPVGGTQLTSPMPGLILKLLVKDGATVTKNQKVLILEAMKMENDILAPADGVINFCVRQGDNVDSGAVLASVK